MSAQILQFRRPQVPAVKTGGILMCPPTYSRLADPVKAHSQWEKLREVVVSLGYQVQVMPPTGGPQESLASDVGVAIGNCFVPARPRSSARVEEQAAWSEWFLQAGFFIPQWFGKGFFEGGDVLVAGDRIYCGIGPRTDDEGATHLARVLGLELEKIQLSDPRFTRLDSCFTPIDSEFALVRPQAILPTDLARLQKRWKCIPVNEPEAVRLACNLIVLGRDIILPDQCPETVSQLERLGFRCHSVDVSEFLQAGGATKSLILHVPVFPR